jgi:hypothetical protein
MFEFIFGVISEILGEILGYILVWLILWPVVFLVCTPFVILRASAIWLFDRRSFSEALVDDYRAISDFWKWVFFQG